MRIIVSKNAVHNETAFTRPLARWSALGAVAAILALGLLAAGCGDSERKPASAEENGNGRTDEAAQAPAGPLKLDDGGWRIVSGLAERFHAGELVPSSELTDTAAAPAFSTWSNCLQENRPNPARIAGWLEAAYAEQAGGQVPKKTSSDRSTMIASYRYSYKNRELIESRLAEWHDPAYQDGFLQLARRWVAPERLPDPISIQFLPTPPELRYCSDRLIVDTGVLAAGRPSQLKGNLVSMLYRNLQALPDFADDERTPERSVAGVFRILANEGVAAWIDNAPFTYFSQDHYSLRKITQIPENFFDNGIKTVTFLNERLPRMIADPSYRDARLPKWPFDAAMGGTLTQAGYAMAATIVHHLGESRLVAARTSVLRFVAAYQEAALRNPAPRPRPGEPGRELAESMPPLDPEVYDRLHELLLQVYGE